MVFGLFNLFRKRNSIIYRGKKYSLSQLKALSIAEWFNASDEKNKKTSKIISSNDEIYSIDENNLDVELTEAEKKEFKTWKMK